MDTRSIEAQLFRAAQLRGDRAAQATAQAVSANAPRDTGKLANAPKVTRTVTPTGITWKVAVDVTGGGQGYPYDVAQEEGTGVYIGKGRIYPRRAPMLVFFWKKVGRKVAFRSVKGTPPTRYFSKAIRGWVERLREAG
jgi:hypothetical protein